jgi:hypothetical protein
VRGSATHGRGARLAALAAAFALCAGPAAGSGPDAVASKKGRTKVTHMTVRMPKPHRWRTKRKTARVAKRLRSFRIQMFVRRRDGVYGPPVEIGQDALITTKRGRKLARVSWGAQYSPGLGRLRYTVRLKNLGVSRRSYKRTVVIVKIVAHYVA